MRMSCVSAAGKPLYAEEVAEGKAPGRRDGQSQPGPGTGRGPGGRSRAEWDPGVGLLKLPS